MDTSKAWLIKLRFPSETLHTQPWNVLKWGRLTNLVQELMSVLAKFWQCYGEPTSKLIQNLAPWLTQLVAMFFSFTVLHSKKKNCTCVVWNTAGFTLCRHRPRDIAAGQQRGFVGTLLQKQENFECCHKDDAQNSWKYYDALLKLTTFFCSLFKVGKENCLLALLRLQLWLKITKPAPTNTLLKLEYDNCMLVAEFLLLANFVRFCMWYSLFPDFVVSNFAFAFNP